MGKLKEHYHDVLIALNDIQDEFDKEAIAIISKCSCSPLAKGMDDLCPHCLAEYEQRLCDNYDSLSEIGVIEDFQVVEVVKKAQ